MFVMTYLSAGKDSMNCVKRKDLKSWRFLVDMARRAADPTFFYYPLGDIRATEHEKLGTRCSQCGEYLIRIDWNIKFSLAVCDNWECVKFRQPQGRV